MFEFIFVFYQRTQTSFEVIDKQAIKEYEKLYFQNDLTYSKIFGSPHLIDSYFELLSTNRALNSVVQRIVMNKHNKHSLSTYYSNFCKMAL